MLTAGSILQNRYRILGLLGQGGMGAVYQAIDQRLDTTVALKECFFIEEPLRKQFEREACLLAKLRHPAMTRVIDHFTEGDGQFLVMEFIPGEEPDLSIRLVLVDPPPGVDFGIQRGGGAHYETLFVQQGKQGDIIFDFP